MQRQTIGNAAVNFEECNNKCCGMQQKINGKQQQIMGYAAIKMGHAVINIGKFSNK